MTIETFLSREELVILAELFDRYCQTFSSDEYQHFTYTRKEILDDIEDKANIGE